MYCPRCKTEYGRGYEACRLCNAPLVDSPENAPRFDARADAPEPGRKEEPADYQEILYTFNPVEISLLKSILQAEGIDFHFQGEHAMFYEPAALLVRADQVERAEEILDDLFGEEEEG